MKYCFAISIDKSKCYFDMSKCFFRQIEIVFRIIEYNEIKKKYRVYHSRGSVLERVDFRNPTFYQTFFTVAISFFSFFPKGM